MQAFTTITEENKALKKENEQLYTDVRRERQKALDSRFELGRLQEQARRLEQKLSRLEYCVKQLPSSRAEVRTPNCLTLICKTKVS